MTDAVIELVDVDKRFGDAVAVKGIDIAIERGEFFSLLGPSGCGKTTSLRMIAGFEQPTSGEIRLEGEDVSKVPPYRRNVNTVFQHYALFPHMTIADNVAFGPRSAKVDKKETQRRVGEMLEVVRLADFAERKPSQLSGGQQQRVALARALVNYPSALLLDEPLGALDLKLRQAMQLELKRIQREVGITFVYVTHDQEEALTMSDRIAVMSEGRVEQIAAPTDIYDDPATVFVAGFIGQANLWPATVTAQTDGMATVSTLGSSLPARAMGELGARRDPHGPAGEGQGGRRRVRRSRHGGAPDRDQPRVPGPGGPLGRRGARRPRGPGPHRPRPAAADAAPRRRGLGQLGHARRHRPARPTRGRPRGRPRRARRLGEHPR